MYLYNLFENSVDNKGLKYTYLLMMNCIALPLILLWTCTGIVFFPLAFVFMKFILKYSTSFLTRKCIWVYGRIWQSILSLFVIFTPLKVHGQPFKNPGVIVVNHRSFFDTFCMNMMPVFDVCFAVRAWPFKMPFFNIFMKLAGYLNIENFSWNKTIKISKENFKHKSFVLFFPEGHRSQDKEMTHFYSGAFKLAIKHNVPVIPICLTGTQTLLPPHRYYLMPTKIKMEVLNPIFPDQFSENMKHFAFKKYVKNIMAATIKQMDSDNR